jgi:translation initiation factor IF-3
LTASRREFDPRRRAISNFNKKSNEQRINREIRTPDNIVKLIDVDGKAEDILIDVALQRAAEAGLDLVEIQPQAKPPICKIMDYGKFKFMREKKVKESRKKQHVVKLKEVKVRPQTQDHDLDFKVKNAIDFLNHGDKVKITVMFKGREMTHREFGEEIMQRIIEKLADHATMESAPVMEGRNYSALFVPMKKQNKKKESTHAENEKH